MRPRRVTGQGTEVLTTPVRPGQCTAVGRVDAIKHPTVQVNIGEQRLVGGRGSCGNLDRGPPQRAPWTRGPRAQGGARKRASGACHAARPEERGGGGVSPHAAALPVTARSPSYGQRTIRLDIVSLLRRALEAGAA